MSTHQVEIIQISAVEPHPNADRLELVRIGGYTCCVKKGDFAPGDFAVYVEPDYIVDTAHPAFAFLGEGKGRIKTRKFRGVWSQGLLLPVSSFPELGKMAMQGGKNVMEALKITRYEPPEPGCNRPGRNGAKTGNSQAEKPHATLASVSVYDLENLRKHEGAIAEGDLVVITEKIHGCNARFAWRDGRMWCGSRTQWRKSGQLSWWQKWSQKIARWLQGSSRPQTDLDKGNVWWRVLDTHQWIVDWCKANQDCVLFGEIFGDVQDLKYGAAPGQLFFRAFDVMREGRFVDATDFVGMFDAAKRAPVLHVGEYSRAHADALALNDSVLAPHMSEGVVVKPWRERWVHSCGRVALKLVSDRYLERA